MFCTVATHFFKYYLDEIQASKGYANSIPVLAMWWQCCYLGPQPWKAVNAPMLGYWGPDILQLKLRWLLWNQEWPTQHGDSEPTAVFVKDSLTLCLLSAHTEIWCYLSLHLWYGLWPPGSKSAFPLIILQKSENNYFKLIQIPFNEGLLIRISHLWLLAYWSQIG